MARGGWASRLRSRLHRSCYPPPMLPRNLRPMRLSRRSAAFDSNEFIYELKIDGFRALAHLQDGRAELVSRNGNAFRGFAELATWIAEHLRVKSAVLDGEIACVDDSGRPNFRALLFRQRQCTFILFDIGVYRLLTQIDRLKVRQLGHTRPRREALLPERDRTSTATAMNTRAIFRIS